MGATLQEIGDCAKANHAFWTAHARLCLTCYRIHKRDGDVTAANLERHAFRRNMQHRRERTYLELAAERS